MLSYEDSKRLKELGYPQELEVGDWYFLPNICDEAKLLTWELLEKWGYPDGWVQTYVKVPTTGGMIEGLGSNFYQLCAVPIWRAAAFCGKDFPHMTTGEGETADQALCRLWESVKR